MTLPHYAQAFITDRGRCFRLIEDDARKGQPTHCENRVAWRGTFKAPNGKSYLVDSCDGHMHDLSDRLSRQIGNNPDSWPAKP
jgi:hypothetical protein